MKWCDTSIIPALSLHIITHAQLGRQLLFFLTSYTFLLSFNTNLGSVSTQSCCCCPDTANEEGGFMIQQLCGGKTSGFPFKTRGRM